MAGPELFRPDSISTGLQGYWKLDEASGTRVDSSANGNDLTDNNTVASVAQDYWKTGENSADFESGSAEYLSRASASCVGLNITGTFSFVCWAKFESDITGYLMTKWSSNTGYGVGRVAGGNMRFLFEASNVDSTGTPAVAIGKWEHYGFVYDTTANTIAFYVNGNLVSLVSATTDPTSTSHAFTLGQRGDSAQFMDGLMKDAAIWSVALTPIQMKSLALGVDLSTLAYRPDSVSVNPTCYLKLNEPVLASASSSRTDSSGNGKTFTDAGTTGAGRGYIEGVGAFCETTNVDYFTRADDSDFEFGSGDFTYCQWLYMSSSTSASGLFNKGQGAGVREYEFQINTGGVVRLQYSTDGTAQTTITCTTSGSGLQLNTWYHIAFVRSGNTGTFYIDGVADATTANLTAVTLHSGTGTIWLGRSENQGSQSGHYHADFATWKGYALSTDEIKSLACGIPLQQTGIVSYWKLDETSGTRADSIGANTLTDNNTVLSGTGKVGNAADFEDANSEYLSGADSDDFDFGADGYSISKWIYFESVGTPRIWSIGGNYASGKGLQLAYSGGTLTLYNNGNAGTTDLFTWTPTAGVWYHLCITRDGANVKLTVNSATISSSANTDVIDGSTGGMTLGVWSGTLNSYFDGLMDEFLLNKRWFRDEEIKTIYNKGLAGKELTSEEITVGGSTGNFFLFF